MKRRKHVPQQVTGKPSRGQASPRQARIPSRSFSSFETARVERRNEDDDFSDLRGRSSTKLSVRHETSSSVASRAVLGDVGP
jgi:hypothetical protein